MHPSAKFLNDLIGIKASFLTDLGLLEDYHQLITNKIKGTRRFDLANKGHSIPETDAAFRSLRQLAKKKELLGMLLDDTGLQEAEDAHNRPDEHRLSFTAQNSETEGLLVHVRIRDIPRKYRTFLNDLVIVHSMTLLEGFVKSYLSTVFDRRPHFLKSSKQVAVEKLIEVRSAKGLRRLLIEKEIDAIGYKSIEKLAEYLFDHFGISMTAQFKGYGDLLQLSDHRNLIVHMDTFNDHATLSKSKKSPTQLKSSSKAVKKGIGTVAAFVTFMHYTLPKKLRLT